MLILLVFVITFSKITIQKQLSTPLTSPDDNFLCFYHTSLDYHELPPQKFPLEKDVITSFQSIPVDNLIIHEIEYPILENGLYYISESLAETIMTEEELIHDFKFHSISFNTSTCYITNGPYHYFQFGRFCWDKDYYSNDNNIMIYNERKGNCSNVFKRVIPFLDLLGEGERFNAELFVLTETYYISYFAPHLSDFTGGGVVFLGGSIPIYFVQFFRKLSTIRQNGLYEKVLYELISYHDNFLTISINHIEDVHKVEFIDDQENYELLFFNETTSHTTDIKLKYKTNNTTLNNEEDDFGYVFPQISFKIYSNKSDKDSYEIISIQFVSLLKSNCFSSTHLQSTKLFIDEIQFSHVVTLSSKLKNTNQEIRKKKRRERRHGMDDIMSNIIEIGLKFSYVNTDIENSFSKIQVGQPTIIIQPLCDFILDNENECNENDIIEFQLIENEIICYGCMYDRDINSVIEVKIEIGKFDLKNGEYFMRYYFNVSYFDENDEFVGRGRIDGSIPITLSTILSKLKEGSGFPFYPVLIVISGIVFVGTTVTCTVASLLTIKAGVFSGKIAKEGMIPLLFGKYVITKSGDHFQVLDLSYKFMHKNIKTNAPRRDFLSLFRALRASKYSSYAHCKYCFKEQEDFNKNSKFKTKNLHCCKCGMPLVNFITFDPEEQFCCICAMMNKYDHNNHGRCLLHLTTPNKSVGATYYLYKTSFSVSSASKKKKESKSLNRLKNITKDEIWKLNSVMRFEYLFLCRNLIGKELFFPDIDEVGIKALRITIEEMKEKRKEMGSSNKMNYVEHCMKLNMSDISEKNRKMFFKNMKELLTNAINTVSRHLKIVLIMQKKEVNQKDNKIIGKKRKGNPNSLEDQALLCDISNKKLKQEDCESETDSFGGDTNSPNSEYNNIDDNDDNDNDDNDNERLSDFILDDFKITTDEILRFEEPKFTDLKDISNMNWNEEDDIFNENERDERNITNFNLDEYIQSFSYSEEDLNVKFS